MDVDLRRLVADAPVNVRTRRAHGWTVSAIGVEHRDSEVQAALIGLVPKVAKQAERVLMDGSASPEELRTALRLWLADQDGRLGDLLMRNTPTPDPYDR